MPVSKNKSRGRSRKAAPSADQRHSRAAALELAKTVIDPRLHASAKIFPAPHAQKHEAQVDHPLTKHLLSLHAKTLHDSREGDVDVIFHHRVNSAQPKKQAWVVQVRSGRIARVLTLA